MHTYQFENAVTAFERALKLEEKPGIYLGLGQTLYEMKDYSSAVQAFQKSVDLVSDWAEPYGRLGWAYYQNQEYELARLAFEQAIGLDDSAPLSFSGLGYTQRKLGNHAQALENFQAWAKLAAGQAPPHRMIGWSYFAMGEYALAVDAFEHSLQIEESADIHYAVGESYRLLKKCEQAVPHYERALNMDPSNKDASEGLSQCQNE